MAAKMHVTTAVSAGQPYARSVASNLIVICSLLSAACGGTSVTELGGPEGVRCQVTLAADSTTVPVDGGAVNVSIDAARDCTWTASSDATWATLSTTAGQGAGTVGVTVASSQQSTVRTAAIIVNNQRVGISQEARPCRFTLSASEADVGAAGGSISVTVAAPDGCTWRASSTVGWIGAQDTARTGSGTVSLEVAPNAGAQRAGVLTIAGQPFTVTQVGTGSPGPTAPGCMPVVDPTDLNVPASAATQSIRLEVAPGCPWTAASNATWLTIASEAAGQGAATVRVAAAQNTGAARVGTVMVAAQAVTIRQAAAAAPPPCTFTLDSGSRSFPHDGGEGRVQVTARTGCQWSASSPADWVTILAGTGEGNGEARYRVQPNPAAQPRSVTITIAGRTHAVNQAGACAFSLSPGAASVDATGGERRFSVNTQAGCGWSVSGAPDWVTIAAGAGTGPGEVIYTVLPNTGQAPRSGAISVGGQSHTIAQAAPALMCAYSVSPAAQTIPAAAGEARFNVGTQAGCTWTAQGGTAWLTLTGSQGSGPGQVVFSVLANPAPDPRMAVITVAGQSHTVTQSGAQVCTYGLSPASLAIPAAGGEGRFTVTTQAGCTWAPTGGAAWIAIVPGSGNGTGEVIYTVERNPTSAERVATIVVNGQPHTVTQAATTPVCTYSLNPPSFTATASGGEGRFTVVTGAGCSWSPATMTSWIRITAGGGSGQGDVVYTIDPNAGTEPRDGTITVADQPHRVTQGGATAPPPPSP